MRRISSGVEGGALPRSWSRKCIRRSPGSPGCCSKHSTAITLSPGRYSIGGKKRWSVALAGTDAVLRVERLRKPTRQAAYASSVTSTCLSDPDLSPWSRMNRSTPFSLMPKWCWTSLRVRYSGTESAPAVQGTRLGFDEERCSVEAVSNLAHAVGHGFVENAILGVDSVATRIRVANRARGGANCETKKGTRHPLVLGETGSGKSASAILSFAECGLL